MIWNRQKYDDRFGNQWSVRAESEPGRPRGVSFTCKKFRLIAEGGRAEDSADLTVSRMKDLFCDAERVFQHGGVEWRVGYRRRSGGGSHAAGGMHTWFRSQHGEERYVTGMLHFRHMPQIALAQHLMAAAPTKTTRARMSWNDAKGGATCG